MANEILTKAKTVKNDEFYTLYHDIEVEVNAYLDYNPHTFSGKTLLLPCDDPKWSQFTLFFAQNFSRLGLKKLMATSYAPEAKKLKYGVYGPIFNNIDPQTVADKEKTNGKLFILDHDISGDGKIDFNDLEWDYLEGDGDFDSDEVRRLRDEADIIVTNPPFSLFRKFMAWIIEAQKQFLIIGNMNAVTYKEIFPLIKENKIWVGATGFTGRKFRVPDEYSSTSKLIIDEKGNKYVSMGNSCWFTNIEHGKRHKPLLFMTMEENLKFSKHKEIRGRKEYIRYDNYDAIEVPFTDAIPGDYDGIMGVPISFLDKYCPEQFEILGITKTWYGGAIKVYPEQIQINKHGKATKVTKLNDGAAILHQTPPMKETLYIVNDKIYTQVYARILIKKR